ncbi:hypothetical protein L2729_00600 [Shewanella gelidimarina]|uniref:hypothetical protein n=1 Tax=Shewanella gelidimarina TaxID=56813 RepID=UPI00200E97FD|nr:hypothetical protein [Shewanella gelidimarina]MCL1056489.1 hypothetical protein [Shewanella gelidimarina]
MTEITYLTGWKPELCIQLHDDHNRRADFNRFLVKNLPSTKELQQENYFIDANRKEIVLNMRDRFQESIDEGGSHYSLYFTFNTTYQYLKWCDKENIRAFTKLSIEEYMGALYQKVLLGSLKKSTYKKNRSRLFTTFTQNLDLPANWFVNITVLDSSDTESFEAYSRSDLNQLLPFLIKLFNQTYEQFIENPSKHIEAHKFTQTMVFRWKGDTFKLRSGISKMMSSATFLLAYYTYTNTSDLFKLKQPKNTSFSVGETWYTMPVYKRRAFKMIQVEMGEHGVLEIPKHSTTFFDRLLKASRILNKGDDALLLKTIADKQLRPMKATTLQDFIRLWIEKHFTFTDQTGRRLRPVISRFRETGSQLTAYRQGKLANDIMLNNTPNTRKKSYSTGNKYTNIGMMQDTLSIRQEQAQAKVSTKEAQQNIAIKVLVIEQEYKAHIPNLSNTPNGGSCANPFNKKAEKYTRKALRHGLAKKGERLACADLLACFGCPEQVIVQSVHNIWCLLSFKLCIEEAMYLHLDAHHYRKNFESVIHFIENKILPKLKKKLIKQAELRICNEGQHPLWSDSDSILELLPSQSNKGHS